VMEGQVLRQEIQRGHDFVHSLLRSSALLVFSVASAVAYLKDTNEGEE